MKKGTQRIALGILLGLLVLAFATAAYISSRQRAAAPELFAEAPAQPGIDHELLSALAVIEANERRMDDTVWSPEILAQECGRTFENLWDAINRSADKLSTAASFPFKKLLLGKWDKIENLPHQIEIRPSPGAGQAIDGGAWRPFIERFQEAGWQLEQVEFRHTRFTTNSAGGPDRSTFWFSAHLIQSDRANRAMIDGDIAVKWSPETNGTFLVEEIDASGLLLKTRTGQPPFREILTETVRPLENTRAIDPLIVYDLDNDGFAEIILAARNMVYARNSEGRYESRKFATHPIAHLAAAVLGDFDGDGSVDLLGAKYEGLFLLRGAPGGTFSEPPLRAWSGAPILHAMVITCGDVDQDGDLDLFLGQYKEPYEGGVPPTPFFDANDGNPAYLFRNEGGGRFTDATAGSGLEAKRNRRTYSASFADLDYDTDLDLVVVSDFSGIEIYRSDGQGRFAEVTSHWIAERHAFGMAHSLADFNSDGLLDILMTGMTSPTVERLDHLGLWRSKDEQVQKMRSLMTFGNRLYLRRETGGFEQTPLSDSLARSGWSWGSAALDFDNDGWLDVYIVNGMESNASVRDYESEPWLHDYHLGAGLGVSALDLYFKSKFSRTRGRDYSYGGYEKNRLFWNRDGKSFVEIGYLMNLALPEDCRNVVADDLDRDGQVDLIVTTLEFWPARKETISIFRNELPTAGNWVAFDLQSSASAGAIGATIRIAADGKRQVRTVVTGDSYRSQNSGAAHFGIGKAREVEQVQITWPNRIQEQAAQLEANRFHDLPRQR